MTKKCHLYKKNPLLTIIFKEIFYLKFLEYKEMKIFLKYFKQKKGLLDHASIELFISTQKKIKSS